MRREHLFKRTPQGGLKSRLLKAPLKAELLKEDPGLKILKEVFIYRRLFSEDHPFKN